VGERQNRPLKQLVTKNQTQKTKFMKILSKRTMVLLFVTALLATVSIGCNTANGFGKDMSAAGQGIQNGTK